MKVVIFEDEPHNSERLIQLLLKCNPTIEVVAIIASVSEGVQWLAKQEPVDLMMMDIQLSDGNCFELFKQAKVKTPIIFTTAYDSFALQAFKVNSIDYLMKPIDAKELQSALKKYEELKPVSNHSIDIARIAEEFLKRDSTRFIGRLNNQLTYVKAKDIAYLHFVKGITYAATNSNQKMPLDYSLDQIEKLLDRNVFFRINRQFIVHIDAIKKITTYYNSRLILQLNPHVDTDVIISRERVSDFKNWLEGKELDR
ncbi:LytR/AlgR family response regulator transcription factor [Chitinophaga nivalis]|uniref:LytTR family DNA-binding domain-containing protein n=1 Tax=Chitinophaga nivalis TaxID=2991709 RepID=A0ABT3IGP0_9BACT|nr:LytTR family DNA-binding domain-containing protein [Chitinophaga nivalis]MCW3467184.1 LytTR family DNA-binding domain-containing protein [Chitinophaga nivalis]MCW3483124.1 LytTR family DNA-binding domain-containing protein [Chitinophaga nivalis]